eukprot:XP_011666520.1 PREDICTED: uncharacterized protein LOC105439346 [Strongylocentrotus purpuratus]
MPNLTDLTLGGMNLKEEFYSTLKAKALSIQVQTLRFFHVQCPTPASSHHLAEALCSMPNLTDLTLEMNRNDEFYCYSTLKAKALSTQGCFPQIRKGNFRFNGVAQDDLNSFLHTLICSQRSPRQPLIGSNHGNTHNTGNVSEQSRAIYQETIASASPGNPVRANISGTPDTLPRGLGANISILQEPQDNVIVRQPLQEPHTLTTQTGFWPDYLENDMPSNL